MDLRKNGLVFFILLFCLIGCSDTKEDTYPTKYVLDNFNNDNFAVYLIEENETYTELKDPNLGYAVLYNEMQFEFWENALKTRH